MPVPYIDHFCVLLFQQLKLFDGVLKLLEEPLIALLWGGTGIGSIGRSTSPVTPTQLYVLLLGLVAV